MSVDRLTRVNALLKREIGDLLFRVIHERGFDPSSVTVTRVDVARNLREARVYVSVRDHEREGERALATLRRHRVEIQRRINADIVLKYTPRLTFELDTSLVEGDRVLSLLSQLVPEAPPDQEADASPKDPRPS